MLRLGNSAAKFAPFLAGILPSLPATSAEIAIEQGSADLLGPHHASMDSHHARHHYEHHGRGLREALQRAEIEGYREDPLGLDSHLARHRRRRLRPRLGHEQDWLDQLLSDEKNFVAARWPRLIDHLSHGAATKTVGKRRPVLRSV